MNAQFNPESRSVLPQVNALVAQYGLIRVATALAAALFSGKRRTAKRFDHDLSGHLRRDIGLERLPERRDYWTL